VLRTETFHTQALDIDPHFLDFAAMPFHPVTHSHVRRVKLLIHRAAQVVTQSPYLSNDHGASRDAPWPPKSYYQFGNM
jgi:hypothetical protein